MSETSSVPAVGSPMPDMPLTGASGETTTLDALRGGRRSVVFFLRASTCAICLGHVKAIGTLPVDAIFVTPGDAAQAAEATKRSGATVWASGEAHAEVGLGTFLAIQHSGSFLVAADGSVEYAKTSTLPMGSFSKSELLAAL